MIPVVINADDFGLTEGVCAGIVKAIQAGGVTATTAMACVPGAVERLKRWAPKIPGHIGAHLQLTSGAPVLPPERVPSLVQDGGQFPAIRKQVRARTEEILFEWRAQIELLRCAGIELTHLDSHHHIHRLPSALPAFCELAKQYGLPARALDAETTRSLRTAGVPCVGRTLTDWYGGELSAGSLVNVLNEGRRDSPEAGSFEDIQARSEVRPTGEEAQERARNSTHTAYPYGFPSPVGRAVGHPATFRAGNGDETALAGGPGFRYK